jgi:hypothetical protein
MSVDAEVVSELAAEANAEFGVVSGAAASQNGQGPARLGTAAGRNPAMTTRACSEFLVGSACGVRRGQSQGGGASSYWASSDEPDNAANGLVWRRGPGRELRTGPRSVPRLEQDLTACPLPRIPRLARLPLSRGREDGPVTHTPADGFVRRRSGPGRVITVPDRSAERAFGAIPEQTEVARSHG